MSKKDGLFELSLGDKKLELKGDWKCISYIEDKLDKGILSFYIKDLAEMNLSLGQIGHVYVAGLRSNSYERSLNHDEVCELIASDGIMTHVQSCMEFVSMLVSGGNIEEAVSEKK